MAINPKIKEKAEKIRKEVYGKDVREALASGLEVMSEDVEETKNRQDNVESQFQNVESQFQAVLDETTGKDVISAPEVTAARVGADGTRHMNLKQRLDSEHDKITAQLAQTNNELITSRVDLGKTLNRNVKPSITIIDDDTNKSLYEILYPFLQEYNIPISAAAISSRIINGDPNTISKAQFEEMRDSRLVEFLNHTHTHKNLTELTPDEVADEIRLCQEWLESNGCYTKHLVYPFGAINEVVESIARKYVHSASIHFNHGTNNPTIRPDLNAPRTYALDRYPFEYGMSGHKFQIDSIVENPGWIILNTHSHYPDFSIEKLREIVEYALSKGVEFVNFSEGFRRFGNVLEITDGNNVKAAITATGKSFGSIIPKAREWKGTVAGLTIPGHRSVNIQLHIPYVKTTDMIVAAPNFPLPNHLIYSIYPHPETDGTAILRIGNVIGSETPLPDGRWTVRMLSS